MNLILLLDEDFFSEQQVRLQGRRLQHVQQVHRARVGDTFTVGRLNGLMGTGTVTQLNDEALEMQVVLDRAPPAKLPLTLILALPRPKMLKRIYQHCASLGVERLLLINSYRVEKSFWQSPFLSEEKIVEHFILGLEQAKDTVLPRVEIFKRFKPFVEDRLPAMVAGRQALVAHPKGLDPCPVALNQPLLLAIGPEGGFIPYEIEKLEQCGFQCVTLGERILRVETAVTALISRLFT